MFRAKRIIKYAFTIMCEICKLLLYVFCFYIILGLAIKLIFIPFFATYFNPKVVSSTTILYLLYVLGSTVAGLFVGIFVWGYLRFILHRRFFMLPEGFLTRAELKFNTNLIVGIICWLSFILVKTRLVFELREGFSNSLFAHYIQKILHMFTQTWVTIIINNLELVSFPLYILVVFLISLCLLWRVGTKNNLLCLLKVTWELTKLVVYISLSLLLLAIGIKLTFEPYMSAYFASAEYHPVVRIFISWCLVIGVGLYTSSAILLYFRYVVSRKMFNLPLKRLTISEVKVGIYVLSIYTYLAPLLAIKVKWVWRVQGFFLLKIYFPCIQLASDLWDLILFLLFGS